MSLTLDLREGYAVATLHWHNDACLLDARTATDIVAALTTTEESGRRAFVLAADGAAFCLGDSGETADIAGRRPMALAAAALAEASIPTMCAIEGHAGEAGLELALASDLRIAGRDATFSAAHLQRGDFPTAGGTQRLSRIAGRATALTMLLLGEPLDAMAAHQAGLVQRVTAAGGALVEGQAWAKRLAAGAPIATQYLKEAILKGMEQPLVEGLQREADLSFLLQTTADRDEGLRAFREKRVPRFEGR